MYSEDGSAQNGGEIGWSYKGRLAQEFADVAFKLTDPNTVSKIVETEFGFHIIQLIEKRGDRINCRHILKKPKASEEAIMKAFADLDSISEELNKGLYTFEQCAQFVSHDKDTRNNYGIMRYVNNETGEVYTKMEMKELPAEVAKQVGHRATMKDDYQTLQDVVQAKMAEEKIEKWIKEKQKTTYVRINEDWRNCDFKYDGWIKK